MTPSKPWSKLWTVSLAVAGINDCGMALYHFFLPFHMGWGPYLDGVPTSIVWALYTLNFSWSLLVLLTGALVLSVARMGPGAGVFARRFVFVVGLFWLVHGTYTWIHPLPMPASLAWLRILLAAFPALMVVFHWWPLFAFRRTGGEPAA
ncbi:MAG: hypothetical protein ACREOU_12840 [Candidatus Eiseniibacteriota bacterium]